MDNVNTLNGGIKQGSAFMGLMDISFTYQSEIDIFKNTTVFAHFLKTSGQAASEDFIGDVQVASNIEGRASLLFYEIWIEQKLMDLYLLGGMHDMNSVFFVSENAGTFINSSFGISPGLSLNMPVSIYPVTTFGTVTRYEKEQFTFLSGLYNLNHEFAEEEEFHIHNHIFEHGFLSLMEFQFRRIKSGTVKSEYKIGGFYKQCNEDGHGRDDICISEKNYGAYLVADQQLYETSNSNKNINAFLQFNTNPLKYSYASEYVGAGVTLNGFLSGKHTDRFGVAMARVKLNDLNENGYFTPGTYETVLELTLKQTIFKFITIQPDIQYIFNPGGTLSNAWVGTLRLKFELSNT
jgi:porin